MSAEDEAWVRAALDAPPDPEAAARWRRDGAAWYRHEPVAHYEAGETLADGPLAVAGWYVDPYCDPLCCQPDGPFADEAAARDWSRRMAAAIAAGDKAAEEALLDEARAPRSA